MKIQREIVLTDPGQSFRLFRPSLKNYFYWHYHPEFELVYVEADAGIRHVGQHMSSYVGSDLVLIGSNVPHLNFDYGLKTDYNQIVVQLKQLFLGNALEHTPEWQPIRELFAQSVYGISFGGPTKKTVATKLKQMQSLDSFGQLLYLLEIFNVLAASEHKTILNSEDTAIGLFMKDKIRLGTVYEYIHHKYNENPDVNEIAKKVHLSTAAFCRYFKKQMNMTFTDFLNQYRISQAKHDLLQGKNVTETCYSVGFESLSYFNKLFRKINAENPSAFRKRYLP